MNKVKHEQSLLDALCTIRRECNRHQVCDTCPLMDERNVCIVNLQSPEYWNLETWCDNMNGKLRVQND